MATNRFVLLAIALLFAPCTAAADDHAKRELEASFAHPVDGAVLPGTLTLPPGDGPFPAVVMIHGSGPQSRHEESIGSLLFSHRDSSVSLFTRIAEQLAESGVASLRYDKRTCIAGNSQGGCTKEIFDWDLDTATLDLFAEDAVAAVTWLRERPEIRPDSVIVLGHSQGAVLAPLVAKRSTGVAGVVLLGCPAADDPYGDHTSQSELVLRYHRSLDDPNDASISEWTTTVAQRADFAATVADGTRTEPFGGSSVKFWTSWFDQKLALRERLQGLDVPVAAFTGGFDANLPARPHLENLRAWRGARDGDLFATVPRTSHALVGLDPANHELAVHEGFLDVLCAWVVATAAGSRMSDTAAAMVTDEGEVTGWDDPITPARDAMLCRAGGKKCDLAGIGSRMSEEMKAAITPEQLAGLLDEALTGGLNSVENLRVDVHGAGDDTTWCQEDLLTDDEGMSSILLTCWKKGPALVGVFRK